MNTEKDIELLCGKQNPFTVPEGYFESLTGRIMSNLPEESKVVAMPARKKSHWLGWASVAAACVAGIVVFSNMIHGGQECEMQAEATVVYDQQYQEDMMEYAMLDHHDVYNYLSGEGY